MSSNRYSTFGRDNQMQSSGGSQSGYGMTSNDRVKDNLEKAQFLLNDNDSNTYMDGYNIGY